MLLATWLVTRDRSAVQPSVASIAVLPFVNLSPDPENEYFSDGITEELINALSNVEGLRVPSRTSVFAFKGKQQDIRHIGKELNVQTVLEGSVRKDKDKLRITAQLINIADGYHIWSQTYERTSNDVFAVQNELAQAIVGKLKPQLLAASGQTLVHQGTSNPEAYDAYLRGKHDYFSQDEATSRRSVEMLRRATTLDPNFARAHAALAQVLANRLNYIAASDEHAAKEGFSAVERALALDPTLGEAYLARARLRWTPASNFQHEAAIKDLKRSLELSRDLTDTWLLLSGILYHVGLFEQAEKAINKALELDRTNLGVRLQQAIVHYYLQRFELSLEELEQIPRNFSPTIWYALTMRNLMLLGRTREAVARYDEFLRVYSTEGGLLPALNALLLASTGQTAAAEQEIKRALESGSPFGHFHHVAYNVGMAYAVLGRIPEAIHWLEYAAETGLPCYTMLAREPSLANLKGTPRFDKLLEKTRKQWEYFKLIAETMPW
jgi:TolB-like protein